MNTSLILPNLRAGGSCFWGVWRLFARLQVCRRVPQSGLNASVMHLRLHLPLSGFVLPHVSAFVPPHVSAFVAPQAYGFVPPHVSALVPPHVSGFVPPHVFVFVPPHVSAFVLPHVSGFVGAHVLILPNLRAGGSCFWGVWRLFARLQVCRRVPQSGLNASVMHLRLHLPLSGFVLPHVSGFVPPHASGFVPPRFSDFVGAHVSAFVPPHVSSFVPPRFSAFVPPHVSGFVPPHVLAFVPPHVLILPNLRAGGSCVWGAWRLFARLQVCRRVPQSGLNASVMYLRLHLPLSGFVPPHVSAFVPPHVSGFVGAPSEVSVF